jgi:hypothetical protein
VSGWHKSLVNENITGFNLIFTCGMHPEDILKLVEIEKVAPLWDNPQ